MVYGDGLTSPLGSRSAAAVHVLIMDVAPAKRMWLPTQSEALRFDAFEEVYESRDDLAKVRSDNFHNGWK